MVSYILQSIYLSATEIKSIINSLLYKHWVMIVLCTIFFYCFMNVYIYYNNIFYNRTDCNKYDRRHSRFDWIGFTGAGLTFFLNQAQVLTDEFRIYFFGMLFKYLRMLTSVASINVTVIKICR